MPAVVRHKTWFGIGRHLPAVVAFASMATAGHAQAQGPDPLDAAFAAMMVRPGDADATLAYAREASARGQTRAAIAALERVLRINPALDNIRLELASLHLAAGSPDVAAVYAQEALASPSIPPEVADRARRLLALAEKGSSRSVLEGSFFVGGGFNSNATQATSAAAVQVFSPVLGFVTVPTPQATRADSSLVLSGQVSHRYDLGLQREGAWETYLVGDYQNFAQIPHDYDLAVFQFDTGPRIGIADLAGGTVSVRPLFSAVYLGYGNRTFAWLYGGGVSVQFKMPPRLEVDLSAIGRYGSYQNSSFRPLAEDYSGGEWTVSLRARYFLRARTLLEGTVYYYSAGAQVDYNERAGPGVAVAVSQEMQLGDYRFAATLQAGLRYIGYGAPDPFLDPGKSRSDTFGNVGAAVTLPLTERLSAVVQYNYVRNNSSYEIYRYTDHAVTAGLRFTF